VDDFFVAAHQSRDVSSLYRLGWWCATDHGTVFQAVGRYIGDEYIIRLLAASSIRSRIRRSILI
jgi:hypothetical protein